MMGAFCGQDSSVEGCLIRCVGAKGPLARDCDDVEDIDESRCCREPHERAEVFGSVLLVCNGTEDMEGRVDFVDQSLSVEPCDINDGWDEWYLSSGWLPVGESAPGEEDGT